MVAGYRIYLIITSEIAATVPTARFSVPIAGGGSRAWAMGMYSVYGHTSSTAQQVVSEETKSSQSVSTFIGILFQFYRTIETNAQLNDQAHDETRFCVGRAVGWSQRLKIGCTASYLSTSQYSAITESVIQTSAVICSGSRQPSIIRANNVWV